MSALAPLTSADADLQDFPFMPLHVSRLRDSDFAAEESPEACWYAVMLWGASWHQLPAGSLPDNDSVLARLAGLGRDVKTFKRHRQGAMRGWVLCSDGRLYHPVVAETVQTAWAQKLAFQERKAKRKAIAEQAAAARWGNADARPDGLLDASDIDASSILDAMPKGRGIGEREKDNIVEEEARAEKPSSETAPPLVPQPGAGLDVQLAAVCERAGISLDPSRKRWADELKRLKGWLDKGYDLETAIFPAIDAALRKLPVDGTIGSLAFIERELFGERAKARVTPKPAGPSAPIAFEREGEEPALAKFREALARAIGEGQYRHWISATTMTIEDSVLVISTDSPLAVTMIEHSHGAMINQLAPKWLGVRYAEIRAA